MNMRGLGLVSMAWTPVVGTLIEEKALTVKSYYFDVVQTVLTVQTPYGRYLVAVGRSWWLDKDWKVTAILGKESV